MKRLTRFWRRCFPVWLLLAGGLAFFAPGSTAALASATSAVSVAPPVSVPGQKGGIDSGDSGDGCEPNDLKCDPWLQKEHKRVLIKLLKSYYAISAGGKSQDPAQAELMSRFTFGVVKTK